MWGKLKATKLHLYLILALGDKKKHFCMCKFIMHEAVAREIVGCDKLRFERVLDVQ
jgi:hypothetical protein